MGPNEFVYFCIIMPAFLIFLVCYILYIVFCEY